MFLSTNVSTFNRYWKLPDMQRQNSLGQGSLFTVWSAASSTAFALSSSRVSRSCWSTSHRIAFMRAGSCTCSTAMIRMSTTCNNIQVSTNFIQVSPPFTVDPYTLYRGPLHTLPWTLTHFTVDSYTFSRGPLHTLLWISTQFTVDPYSLYREPYTLYCGPIHTLLWTLRHFTVDFYSIYFYPLYQGPQTQQWTSVHLTKTIHNLLWAPTHLTVDLYTLYQGPYTLFSGLILTLLQASTLFTLQVSVYFRILLGQKMRGRAHICMCTS